MSSGTHSNMPTARTTFFSRHFPPPLLPHRPPCPPFPTAVAPAATAIPCPPVHFPPLVTTLPLSWPILSGDIEGALVSSFLEMDTRIRTKEGQRELARFTENSGASDNEARLEKASATTLPAVPVRFTTREVSGQR